MNTISKNLKNLFKIRGRKENLNEFITKIKEEFDIMEVELPEGRLDKIDSIFINKNWNQNVNLEKTALIGKKGKSLILLFANPEFEYAIIELIFKLNLDADYTYLLENDDRGVIVREFFENGESLIGEEYESLPFEIKYYDIQKCFKTMYPVKV